MKSAKFFDWRKGAMCLMSVVSLCSALGATLIEENTTLDTGVSNQTYTVTVEYEVDVTGAKIIEPKLPVPTPPYFFEKKGIFLGYFGKYYTSDSREEKVELKVFDGGGASVGFLPGVLLPPAPTTLYAKWSSEADSRDNTEPIIFVCGRFFKSDNANLLKVYDERIAANPADYEAYICRAFARVATLWKVKNVKEFAIGCGLDLVPETGIMKRRASLDTTIMNAVRTNEKMDEICSIAVPVFKAAISDLDQLPKDWSGDMEVSKETGYEVDETVYFDYADAQLVKAVFCEVISFLNLVRGYRDPVTGKPDGINPDALDEARVWWTAAVMQLSAFNIAQNKWRDYGKHHFFELQGAAFLLIDDNVQNLLDLPYWTARVDLILFEEWAFTGKGEWTKKRRAFLTDKHIDISLRSIFEGKVSVEKGTFPEFYGNSLYLNTLPDATLGGTFPGMSRTMLGEYAKLFGDIYPYAASDEVKEYAVFYKLPKGAKNNPENPATFAADLQSKIELLPPTLEGHKFTGWTNGGVIPPGTANALTFEATFAPLPLGHEGNPWKIGAATNDTVVAWTNGTILVVDGKGTMKGFAAGDPVPWPKDGISLVTVGSGVTSLGNAAFADSPTGEGAEIVFKNPAAVINIGAFVGDDGTKTNVPAVTVETVDKDGQIRRVVPRGFVDVADTYKVYPTLQAAIDAGASAVTPKICSGLLILFR